MSRNALMLDTNIVSYLMRSQYARVTDTLRRKLELNHEICVSAISLAEIEYGLQRMSGTRRLEAYQRVLSSLLELVRPVEWPINAAANFAKLRRDLESEGEPIGHYDSLIAAHALSMSATLVTNNESEFRRVPGLKVENWTK